MTKAKQILRAMSQWPVDSQSQARRNALVAATALTQRRLESLEAETFLRECQGRFDARGGRTVATG